MRYRTDNHDRLPSPLLLLLGDKDDMTPAQPCIEYAEELARIGNAVSFKIYSNTYHAFDRENQPYRQFEEGNFNRCSIDTWMPSGLTDPTFGPAVDKATGKTLKTPAEWGSYIEKCKQTSWITVQTNATARAQAIKDVLNFFAVSSR
jgi:dienelactone hydrolase